ncbi:MAG: phosphoribosylamine--glycine ligase [Treponema sp.]|nr:phosphoribosylamine--glycine ligase [Treponema sp.]
MKVLVIGSGGREHALVWKLAQSPKVDVIYAAPGNGGTAVEDKTQHVNLAGMDPSSEEGQVRLLQFAQKEEIDLCLVGPEAPLAAGLADRFRKEGMRILGPGARAARLESSKIYSKSFMAKHGIRAAASKSFTDYQGALQYAEKHFSKTKTKNPLVIKADGLASGKGVVIAGTAAEAKTTLDAFMKQAALGEAGKSLILEEYLEGQEVSIMAAVHAAPGKKGIIKPFISARDHKRLGEGNLGPNTGGMGAIAPAPGFTAAQMRDFEKAILAPTLKGMEAENMDYQGFIFFGLLIKEESCYLLEYNVRLGDPETQALLPLMESDFAELCLAVCDGNLQRFNITWKEGAVCAPVAVGEGYPGPGKTGLPIAVNETRFMQTGAQLFIAGAQRGEGGALGSGLRTSGGRILSVAAHGQDTEEACKHAYEALGFVEFEGIYYRRDIGREPPAPWSEEA